MRGYHSTSTHDILGRAGVSSGALHHHFPTKKDIGLAVIRERVARVIEGTWVEPVRSAPSVEEGIASVFDQVASSLAGKQLVLGCPLYSLAVALSLLGPDVRDAAGEIYDVWRTTIADRVRAEFPEVDAEAAATFIVASYTGAIALAKAKQDPSPLKACARQLSDAIGQWRGHPRG